MCNTSTFDMKYFIHVTKDGDYMYQNCESFVEATKNIVDFDMEMEDELSALLLKSAREFDMRLREGLPVINCCQEVNLDLSTLGGMWEVEYTIDEVLSDDDCDYENELF